MPKTKEQIRKYIIDHYDYMYGCDLDKYSKDSMRLVFKEYQAKAERGELKTIGRIERFKR